jgi:hypothetical protein
MHAQNTDMFYLCRSHWFVLIGDYYTLTNDCWPLAHYVYCKLQATAIATATTIQLICVLISLFFRLLLLDGDDRRRAADGLTRQTTAESPPRSLTFTIPTSRRTNFICLVLASRHHQHHMEETKVCCCWCWSYIYNIRILFIRLFSPIFS